MITDDFFNECLAKMIASDGIIMVYGNAIGEVEQDEEDIENMKNLGQNMAWILKKIHNS
ncbi:iron-sulfur flavoprotein [Methanosarcina horonobensis HB-1 = JCM 15518]|uniref:Iron-sulfur flavoprotein n=1 Tax=Methanosarcina horonobensis HB-1 = JCM 15518 TaxID=1434110 RepID=A0A0E3SDB9_9EURY|nr:iron-sulfur flavoprotein [Methanosarcina horonobensis HB-1 = JCM 15518]